MTDSCALRRRAQWPVRRSATHDSAHVTGIEEQGVRVHVGGFVRNQEQCSIRDLPAGALAAERYCHGAVRPPSAGIAAHRRIHEARRDHIAANALRSEEHTSELQSHVNLVCRLLLEKKNKRYIA